MAKRIAIVLSQLNGASPAQRDLEGAMVAELLMVQGLEVTLVNDLMNFVDDDTNLLCLEGIAGDMVMMSWMPSADVHRHLDERGIQGRFGRTTLSSGGNASLAGPAGIGSARTIYHIDLRSVEEVNDCCAEIQRIRNEASVEVVGLGLIGTAAAKPPEARNASDGSQTVEQPPKSSSADVPSSPVKPITTSETESDDEDRALDELMDQFDAWDA